MLRGCVSDRHRHDEFIWALIFSLIINLLFVFALLAQRHGAKSPGLLPYVVSIAMSQQTHPRDPQAILGPTAIPTPAKRKKEGESAAAVLPQNPIVDPALAARVNDVETSISSVAMTESTEKETDLSPFATAGESSTITIAKETADGLSIFGDKVAGDHYTAPEYLGGVKPPYPKRAERNGWEGTVLLSLLINANGEVEKVGIAKTSGYDLLDHQARESAAAWRFKPARRNGIAIAVNVQQPVIFRPTPQENIQ